jgi:hypothetical protein
MTTTRSTQPDDLDRFEVALLAELRSVVADRAPARRRKRLLTLGGVAATAAAAVGIGLAVGGSSPAFAVHQEADGDVVVTINRLDDAAGLERALAAQGVTADVDYTHPITMKTTDGGSVDVIPFPSSRRQAVVQRGVPEGKQLDCSFGVGGYLTLDAVDGGYVLTIPHESVLADTPLRVVAAESAQHHATLAVSYYDRQCVQIAAPKKSSG